MTRKTLNEYIKRQKAKRGTWRAFGEALGIDYRTLEGIAADRRKPNEAELTALGVVETTEQSFRFTTK